MSTCKAVTVNVGGAAIAAAAGIAVVAALGAAVAATVALAATAIQKAVDAKKKAEIEARKRVIEDLQQELEAGQRAAHNLAESRKVWRLEAKCSALNERLQQIGQRASLAALQLPQASQPIVVRKDADRAELEEAIRRLEATLHDQEKSLHAAIVQAVEAHTAAQGSIAAIDRLAALPPPPVEAPAELLAYFEETKTLLRARRSEAVKEALRESLERALLTVPEGVSRTTLTSIATEAARLGRAENEVQAADIYQRVLSLIATARAEAQAAGPLRNRMATVCKLAEDLVYARLDETDLRLLADESFLPDEAEVTRLENLVEVARAQDAARIAAQQRRFVMAATLDVLQQAGYETSVVDETAWFERGSMFISRPEWGDFVVRITPGAGTFRVYAGRYVGDLGDQPEMTPEMEAYYTQRIDEWRGVHLKDWASFLKARGIDVSISELETDPKQIQRVTSSEIGKSGRNGEEMVGRIEQRIVAKQTPGAGAGVGRRQS